MNQSNWPWTTLAISYGFPKSIVFLFHDASDEEDRHFFIKGSMINLHFLLASWEWDTPNMVMLCVYMYSMYTVLFTYIIYILLEYVHGRCGFSGEFRILQSSHMYCWNVERGESCSVTSLIDSAAHALDISMFHAPGYIRWIPRKSSCFITSRLGYAVV